MTLIARLEAAEAGSRSLDDEVGVALFPPRWVPYPGVEGAMYNAEQQKMAWTVGCTTSIDAAKALIERVLPGRVITLEMAGSAEAYIHGDPCEPTIKAFGNTPALAMCIALLRAKEAKGE